ncbi:hypothetical protein BK742_03940 [Bacillus thuringiensis serovar pingluonsis]|uniref:Uncharacterized protein n=2 Tax=Bacillus thuringiensis TaxID=1428 RepID=A0A9W3VGI3_BACTU|nr:hypothetical protein [Bacillus thuringiensis]AMR06109.1 hypothetical protein AXW78_30155 [Bacillus thuringiensis]AYF84836.1 hypothetical protein D7J84_27635 [Bacillus thuringiensis]OTY48290.1 hypothetical protein BK742_03940 [Bacillus thuringiensis serovar pingluonsis]PNK29403.1 hypothetical protein CBR55_30935 [Bacillus thuringiensis]
MSNNLILTLKGKNNYKKLLMKLIFLSTCFIFISFKSNISYASEVSNQKTANTKVYGILGKDRVTSNEVEENHLDPIEEISTIIKKNDKSLPETGGHFYFISTFLGITLLYLGIVMSVMKRINKKCNCSEVIR